MLYYSLLNPTNIDFIQGSFHVNKYKFMFILVERAKDCAEILQMRGDGLLSDDAYSIYINDDGKNRTIKVRF